MKPRTVYEKAVQDFTKTAQRLARLNQHFRQASFAEFEMLMVDDEVLKRYGLPKPSGRSSKCIKPSCSISRDTRITLDGGADGPWPVNGWGLFVPNMARPPCIFWTTSEV